MNEVKLQSNRQKIGRLLRIIRERTGRNQSEIAGYAGISTSMLSQIERGIVSPSIDTLIDVCQALGVEPGELFNRLSVRKAVQIHKSGNRLRTRQNGIHYEQVAASNNPGYPAELILLRLAPGSQAGVRSEGHEGIEMGYVCAGEAVLSVGDDQFPLRAGDGVSFASSVPHRLINTGAGDFQALWSVSPPHQNYLDLSE